MYNRSSYIEASSPIEKELLTLFKNSTPGVIFDIGSCEGEDSIKYSRLFPACRIIAFEPLPDNQRLIKENMQTYSVRNVEVMPVALSDKKGFAEFHVSSGGPPNTNGNPEAWNYGNKSSSLLKPDKHLEQTPWIRFDQVISVPTDTLENIFSELQILYIDFAHMDVQGAELQVLKGAGKLLQNIKVIWMEVADIPLYKDQPLKNEVEEFMKKNGFVLFVNSIQGSTGDQMYINKKYFKLLSLVLKIKKIF